MNGNDENDFESFLVNKGFKVKNITDPKVQYLILGSSKVDELEVYQQIQTSIDEGFELFIYTQELFVAWLISRINPLQEWTEEELLISVSDHDPMQSVIDHEEFTWPEITEANTNNDKYSIKDFEWDGSLSEESPLGKMGYTVRVDSISVAKRREILKNAYSTSQMDRYLMNKSDRERWGKANSAQRLYAIARLISWLIGFQGTTKPVAREKWKEDLIWLKSNFYQADKGMKFSWPRASLTPENLKKIKEKPKPAATQTALNPASAWPFPNGSRP
jgi:hypothetical protein